MHPPFSCPAHLLMSGLLGYSGSGSERYTAAPGHDSHSPYPAGDGWRETYRDDDSAGINPYWYVYGAATSKQSHHPSLSTCYYPPPQQLPRHRHEQQTASSTYSSPVAGSVLSTAPPSPLSLSDSRERSAAEASISAHCAVTPLSIDLPSSGSHSSLSSSSIQSHPFCFSPTPPPSSTLSPTSHTWPTTGVNHGRPSVLPPVASFAARGQQAGCSSIDDDRSLDATSETVDSYDVKADCLVRVECLSPPAGPPPPLHLAEYTTSHQPQRVANLVHFQPSMSPRLHTARKAAFSPRQAQSYVYKPSSVGAVEAMEASLVEPPTPSVPLPCRNYDVFKDFELRTKMMPPASAERVAIAPPTGGMTIHSPRPAGVWPEVHVVHATPARASHSASSPFQLPPSPPFTEAGLHRPQHQPHHAPSVFSPLASSRLPTFPWPVPPPQQPVAVAVAVHDGVSPAGRVKRARSVEPEAVLGVVQEHRVKRRRSDGGGDGGGGGAGNIRTGCASSPSTTAATVHHSPVSPSLVTRSNCSTTCGDLGGRVVASHVYRMYRLHQLTTALQPPRDFCDCSISYCTHHEMVKHSKMNCKYVIGWLKQQAEADRLAGTTGSVAARHLPDEHRCPVVIKDWLVHKQPALFATLKGMLNPPPPTTRAVMG